VNPTYLELLVRASGRTQIHLPSTVRGLGLTSSCIRFFHSAATGVGLVADDEVGMAALSPEDARTDKMTEAESTERRIAVSLYCEL